MRAAYIYLHLSIILAGFTGVFGRLIELNEGLLVWYRILLATGLFGIVLFLKKIPVKRSKKEVFRIGIVGCILAIHWLFFYASIKYSNISVGVVCFGLTSFFTSVLEPYIRKRKFIPSELLLSLITILGITLVFHFDIRYRTGIILGVLSSFFASIYTIGNKDLVEKYNPFLLNFYQLGAGTLFIGLIMPIYLHFNSTSYIFPHIRDWTYIFLLSFFCTLILYILFFKALEKISAFTVSLSYNLEPIYSILLAFLIFRENQELNPVFYIGITLVMISVGIQGYLSYKRQIH